MRNELGVLININNDGNTTQRDIARLTGMSLGNVNILIRRLTAKGLLKIEKSTSRTIRYILTPSGIREKAEATYKYIINSLQLINKISLNVDKYIKNHSACGYNKILLFGQKDELFDMICHEFDKGKIEYIFIENYNELKNHIDQNENYRIIIWNPDYIELVCDYNLNIINLLDL